MILPVILSGGSGTRLWPLSRLLQPKQLSRLVGERTMLQETALRAASIPDTADPLVVCNEAHLALVTDQLRDVDVGTSTVVLEPMGRNTAPAVAVAAFLATAGGEDPVLLILPADHVILDRERFEAAVGAAASVAEDGRLVTFGIVPDKAHTGYGYIERGEALAGVAAYRVSRFVEKPDEDTAAGYVKAGTYLWNSGMFVFRASRYLEELTAHAPAMVDGARVALAAATDHDGALLLDPDAFGSTPADSVDYAVMEKTRDAVVVPLDAGWSDVGAWPAIWEIGPKDPAGNVLSGDVMAVDATGSYVRSTGRLVAVIGIDDLVVVETPDAVLVCRRERAQDVKKIAERLEAERRPEAEHHPRP